MTNQSLDILFQPQMPDLEKIESSREDINYKVEASGKLYLPALKEELFSLREELHNTDKQTLRALDGIPVALRSEGKAELFEAIEKLKKEPPTDEIKEALVELSKEIVSLIEMGLSKTKELTHDLDNSLTNLSSATISDSRFRIDELQQSIDANTPLLKIENDAVSKLESQKELLNEAISALEKLNLADKLKPLLKSLEQLADIDPTKLDLVKAIRAAIKGVENILDLVSEAITYSDLLRARKMLQESIEQHNENITRLELQVDEQLEQIRQLKAAQSVDGHRKDYVLEVRKIAETANAFLNSYPGINSEDLGESIAEFDFQAKALIDYLDEIRKLWRS